MSKFAIVLISFLVPLLMFTSYCTFVGWNAVWNESYTQEDMNKSYNNGVEDSKVEYVKLLTSYVAVNQRYTEATEELHEVSHEHEETLEEMATIRTQLETATTEKAELQSSYDSLLLTSQEQTQSISNLQDQLNSMQNQMNNLYNEINRLYNENEDLRNQLNDASSSNYSYDALCPECAGVGTFDRTETCYQCGGTGKEQTMYLCSECMGTHQITCSDCNGTGNSNGMPCSTCSGSGYVPCTACENLPEPQNCFNCNGTGSITYSEPCSLCNGEGIVDIHKVVNMVNFLVGFDLKSTCTVVIGDKTDTFEYTLGDSDSQTRWMTYTIDGIEYSVSEWQYEFTDENGSYVCERFTPSEYSNFEFKGANERLTAITYFKLD